MSDKVYKIFILTHLQLDILLNRLGYTKLYGIEAEYDKDSVNQQQVYSELADMVKKGFLENEDSKFVINKQLKGTLKNMAEAKVYIHILSHFGEGQEYMCYLNRGSIIITGLSRIRNNRVTVTEMVLDEFKENILRDSIPECILERDNIEEEEKEETDYRLEKTDEEKETKNIELFKTGMINNELIWYCEIMREAKKYSKEIYVMECNLELYSLVIADDARIRKKYDREEHLVYVINEITRIRDMKF